MASLFDISLLNSFSNIFVILFIFTAVYGVLMFKKPFGEIKGVYALLAATVALIFIFSQDAIEVIKETVPWFVIMMVVLVFMALITRSYGIVDLPETITGSLGTWVFIVCIIVLMITVSMRIGQKAGPFLSNTTMNPDSVTAGSSGDVGSGNFGQNFGATLFHPKVLAFMLIIIVSTFAVLWIGYTGY
jgi:hypothetical protein